MPLRARDGLALVKIQGCRAAVMVAIPAVTIKLASCQGESSCGRDARTGGRGRPPYPGDAAAARRRNRPNWRGVTTSRVGWASCPPSDASCVAVFVLVESASTLRSIEQVLRLAADLHVREIVQAPIAAALQRAAAFIDPQVLNAAFSARPCVASHRATSGAEQGGEAAFVVAPFPALLCALPLRPGALAQCARSAVRERVCGW
jgi:hypothetical protein